MCPTHSATYFQVCVDVHEGRVAGYVRWYYSDGRFDPATVYVRQCRVDMSGCVVIAANRASGTNIVSTSSKPAPYGHVFQACASIDVFLEGRHYDWVVNYCTHWRSWP